jgi:hypothetical protein
MLAFTEVNVYYEYKCLAQRDWSENGLSEGND